MSILDVDVAVIGSGAGGATTAAVLAEGGRRVTILEEGPRLEPGAAVEEAGEPTARRPPRR